MYLSIGKLKKTRVSLSAAAVSAILAFMISVSSSVDANGGVHWLWGLARAIPLGVIFVILFSFIGGCVARKASTTPTGLFHVGPDGNSGSFSYLNSKVFHRAVILLISWLPYAAFLYPGVVTFDTSFQLCQFFGNDMPGIFPVPSGFAFTDHHPIMVTLLFGSIVKIGSIFGSYNAGFFLLCLVIASFTAFSISITVTALERYGIKVALSRILIAFFALFPVVPFMVMTPSKDSLFSPLFLLFALFVTEIVLTNGDRLKDRRFAAMLIVAATLIPLSKKTGVYIILVSCMVLSLLLKHGRLKVLMVGAASFAVCSILVPSFLFPALNVAPGSKVEMLGPLYQQTARLVSEHGDEIGDDDRKAIDDVLGFDTLADRYVFTIVDTVIHAYDDVNIEPSGTELLSYLKTYATLGLEHPMSYVDAFVSVEKGWFDPAERMLFTEGDGLQLSPPNGEPDISRSALRQRISAVPRLVVTGLQKIPGVDILFTPLTYTALIPGICLLFIKGSKKMPLLIPLIASLAFLLLSPVSLCSQNIEAMRYLLPFIYMSPVYLAVSLGIGNQSLAANNDLQ